MLGLMGRRGGKDEGKRVVVAVLYDCMACFDVRILIFVLVWKLF